MDSFERIPRTSEGANLAARIASAAAAVRPQIVLDWLRAAVAELSGQAPITPLQPDRKLFEVGLQSVHLHALRARVEQETGVALPVTLFFAHATLAALTDRLLREMGATGAIDASSKAA